MIQNIQNIYSHLGDEESRKIYADRLLYSMTGDRKYMTDIIICTALYQKVKAILEKDIGTKYIVSAGQWGKIIADLFYKFGFTGMIDNYVSGTYRNLPIITMKEYLSTVSHGTVYIASTSFHTEFYHMLKTAGIEDKRIVDVTGMMLDVYHYQQYFDLPFLTREDHEIFVDGGCYDGENAHMFVKWAGNVQKTILAFEPDEVNFRKCYSALEEMGGVTYQLISKGLWSTETTLDFCASSNEGSRFTAGGHAHLPVTSLDAAIDGKVTFIKMDIEGAEYEALKGAQNLIRNYKPKLAIAIYHKPDDIWQLPALILSYYPQYTFYLRHYSLSSEETVLYAVG